MAAAAKAAHQARIRSRRDITRTGARWAYHVRKIRSAIGAASFSSGKKIGSTWCHQVEPFDALAIPWRSE